MLLRLWFSGCPVSLICGVYGIGNGLSRFVEEAYRGEPQTSIVWGLRLYQWLAVGSTIIGALLTTLPWPGAPMLALSGRGVLCAMAFASISGVHLAMTPASASLVTSSGITCPSTPPITSAVC